MESISLLLDGSIPKLLLNAPSSSVVTMASCLSFDLKNKAPFSRLSSSSTNAISIGSIWNVNTRNKLLAYCGNVYGWEEHLDAIEDPLKSLLSLVYPKEKSKHMSAITRTKSEALKLVVDKKYKEAECHMNQFFNGNADVAYEARMAHIQILIHLDEYEKALRFFEEERNFSRCEGRLYLYKAVVHTMLDKDDSAEKWWNKYLETLGNGNVNENLKIIDCRNTNSESSLKGAKDLLKPLLSLKPAKEEKNSVLSNIIPIKNMALKKVVNGDYDLAECLMQCQADLARNSEEALEAQVAYIHILIYLDKYEEALKRLSENQNQFPPTDARPCLYKAIGLTVLGNHEDAKICWKAFMKTIGTKGLTKPPNEN